MVLLIPRSPDMPPMDPIGDVIDMSPMFMVGMGVLIPMLCECMLVPMPGMPVIIVFMLVGVDMGFMVGIDMLEPMPVFMGDAAIVFMPPMLPPIMFWLLGAVQK